MFLQKLTVLLRERLHKSKYAATILFAALISLCGGCGHHRPINLTIAKERVEHYHECGQYDKDLRRIVNKAQRHFEKISAYDKATVVFDIDETVLSEYADLKSISFGYIPKLSHEWILRASTPAIPQVKQLYDYLVKRGFNIIFLTGRKYDEYDATVKNLKAQGFAQFAKLIVRQKNELHLTAQEYKTSRRKQLASQGYRIVGNIGDQWSDLEGGYSGYTVKLPNFRYIIH